MDLNNVPQPGKQNNTRQQDEDFKNRLPNECWANILKFLPRLSRQSLAELDCFKELVDGELNFILITPDLLDESFFCFVRHLFDRKQKTLLCAEKRKSAMEQGKAEKHQMS